MNQDVRLRLLRLLLFASAFAWGISVVGVFVSWPEAVNLLQGLGLKTVPVYDPMLDYWLRMASGAFALVGLVYLVAGLQPRTHRLLLPLLGGLMLLEGLILVSHGLRLHLGPFPFLGDSSICFFAGGGILWLRKAVD